MPKIYLVGGTIRDKYLGLPFSGDIDFAVAATSYEEMVSYLVTDRLIEVKLESPKYVRVKAKIDLSRFGQFAQTLPNKSLNSSAQESPVYADFTLCRSDGCYSDTRHPDTVSVGTLEQDLARRDFTCNAIAIGEDDIIHDPHNGIDDIKYKWINTVGSAYERLSEDALRILRAMRFHVTKKMNIAITVADAMHDNRGLLKSLPVDRIREEVDKMFRFDTIGSQAILQAFPLIRSAIFTMDNLWLKPTTEKRGKDAVYNQAVREGQSSLQES